MVVYAPMKTSPTCEKLIARFTKDPKRACRRRNIHAQKTRDALGLAGLRHLQDILRAGHRHLHAIEGDSDDGECRDLLAIDDELRD